MPRRNQTGPSRKGPGRSGTGRSGPGRGGPRAKSKSFGKADKPAPRTSSEKSFGSKRSSAPPGRRGEKFQSAGKPKSFGKTDRATSRGSSSERSFSTKRSSSTTDRREEKFQSGGKRYKRSETGSARPSDSKRYSGGDAEKKPFGQKSRFSKSPSNKKPANSPGAYARTGGDERRKGRSVSFGKPYKKTYRSAGDRQGSAAPRRRAVAADEPLAPKSDKVRLNKFIANSGVSSRREADELITMGLISVNGKIVSELGYKVSPGDEVRYEDKVLRAEKPVYILMNKPKGFLTTTDDPQERKTVMHIVGSAVKERIYPVGRLDRNTTGLLLLTNDGDLADKLMHPSFNVKKVYKAELDKPLTKADFQSVIDGVRLEEGRATVDDLAIVSEDGRTVGIELHIGWNRVVRRIFESLGYEVLKLDRTVYAGLDKKELSRGQWRFLSKEEIIHLKHFK